jgi:nitrous oxidase accessory protein NosD
MKRIFFLSIAILPLMIYAANWTVGPAGCDFTTIQSAIDDLNVVSGDIISVIGGGPYGPLEIGNKGLTIVADGTVIIDDGDTDGHCIEFTSSCLETTTIKGFIVQDGNPAGNGGGIYIENRNVTIENCIIQQNHITGDGGGIFFSGNDEYTLTIKNCVIKDNVCMVNGGGIYFYGTGADSLVIDECDIHLNIAEEDGGGIYCDGNGEQTVKISNCTIYSNECNNNSSVFGGGGILCLDSKIEFDYLTIYGNTSCYNGGGIFVRTSVGETPEAFFDNLLVYENHSEGHGSGICIQNIGNAAMYIKNCTVADNTQTDNNFGGIHVSSHAINVINCIVYGNDGQAGQEQYLQPEEDTTTYSCIEGGYGEPEYMNIGGDPEFVSGTNYTLEYWSPCIDTGDPDSDNDPDGSPTDMGWNYHAHDVYTWQYGGSVVRYIWRCFPRLPFTPPVTSNTGQGIEVDEAWEFWDPIPDGLTAWYANEGTVHEIGSYNAGTDIWSWTYSRDIYSARGYKLDKDDEESSLMFSRGLLCEDTTELTTTANTTAWLGYFLEASQKVLDAFPQDVINDAIKIWTSSWCISRATTVDPWSGTPNSCYIHYTDAVLISTVNQNHTFTWETPGRDNEVIYRLPAEHFTFDEDIEYFPVYVEFAENDIPEEVAIFIDGTCHGAEVVNGTVCQICSHILQEEPGQEIEFRFWNDERSEIKRIRNYSIESGDSGIYESGKLLTGSAGIHYKVSFRDNVDEINPVKYNLICYPNPFNPEMRISFSLEETQNVKLDIFNLRGQKVKSLVDETFRPDSYDIIWEGDDSSDRKVSSGVYYVRLQVGDEMVNRKVILLK